MAAKSQQSDFERRIEKKSDFHFIEYWKEGKDTLDWYAEWRPLNACVYEIEIIDTFNVCEEDRGLELEPDLTKSTPPGKQGNVSEEEQAKYIDLIGELPYPEDKDETEEEEAQRKVRINVFNKRFRIPDIPHSRAIVGKCSLEDDRGLGLIEDGQEPPLDFPNLGNGTISIRPAEVRYLGSVGVVDESDLQWDRTGETQVGDLWFEFYVMENTFDGIVKRIREIGPSTVLFVDFRALVFQGEVDRNLAEPYHRQTFYLEKGKYSAMGHAVLEGVRIVTPKPVGSEPVKGYRDHAIQDDNGAPHDNDWLDEPPKATERLAREINESQKPIRLWPVTLALWAVFFGLVLNALAQ